MADPPTASPDARVRVRDLWSSRGRYRILCMTWFGFVLGIRTVAALCVAYLGRTLAGVRAGTAVGVLVLSTVRALWPWVVACMACSFFVQARAGATFGIAPLVKKRVSVQVAGIVGDYGNIGAPARPVDARLADVAVAS